VFDPYRLSFDAGAEAYEAARPEYADEAVAWIAERLPFGRVLDLAAGTGKLTRQLVRTGAEVVAVEPGPEMRAVLARVVPNVEVLAGSAEAIPLPDRSVDAVTVGQAFHWFHRSEALAEMHRVLKPGGGFALLWNLFNDVDPLLKAIGEFSERVRPPESLGTRDRLTDAGPHFGPLEERIFRRLRRYETDELVAWVASSSWVVAGGPEMLERVDEEVRAIAGPGPVEVLLGTLVIVADRI